MKNLTRRGFIGSLTGMAAAATLGVQQAQGQDKRSGAISIKITDLKCAVIGNNPVVRVVTDQGISGYGQAESSKPYLKPMVLFYKHYLIGEDPTNIASIMQKIRRMGGFKPWGAAVSAIEIALWDIAGQVVGLPVHKLLGGKLRDRVRIYNGGVRFPMKGYMPEDFAEAMAKMKAAPEGFTLIKQQFSFHVGDMMTAIPNAWYGEARKGLPHPDYGMLTERGFDHFVACAEAMKKVCGDEVGLALDCGPGWTVKDAIRFARAMEPLHLAWLEDMITGDYTQYPNAQVFKEVTDSTSTPIHTGEEIYLRENLQRSHRDSSCECNRSRSGRCWRPGGIEVDRRVCEPSRHPGRSSRIIGRIDRIGRGGSVGSHSAGQLYRLRVSDRQSILVVRHSRRVAAPDRQERLH